jgi:lysophospholipase L1-like esterase
LAQPASEPHAARRRLPLGLQAAALAAPAAIFALLLIGVEAAVRWTQPRTPSLEAFVRSSRQRADFVDRSRVSIFEGDPLLFWRLKPGLDEVIWDFTLLSTNAQRLRSERPLAAKRAGATRIVCLGDSITFGYRVPVIFAERPDDYDRDAHPFPMLVERWLREANPGRQIEAVALAVPGYSSHQGLAWLRRDIAALQPDVVTACFGWNDVSLRRVPDSQGMRTGWLHSTGRRILGRSQALIRLSRWLQTRWRSPRGAGPLVTRVSQDEYVANHLAIARLAREHGAAAVIIAPVYRDAHTAPEEALRVGSYRRALADAMRRADIPYLEIPSLIESNDPATRPFFGERIHPNQAGHRVVAEALIEFLAEHRLMRGVSLRVPEATAAGLR